MFALTQILTTLKACQQTGVNLLVTFFFTMAEGGSTQASLKREIKDISKQIFEINIKIQSFQSQGPNNPHIPALKEAKLKLQEKIVQLEIQLQYTRAQREKAQQ